MIIRPFDYSDHDYTAITTIHNAVYPNYPRTEANARNDDEQRIEKYRLGRLIAFVEDKPVGEAWYGQFSWSYQPHKFEVGIKIMPDYCKQGIGTALYDQLMATVAPFEPKILTTMLFEDAPAAIRFAEKRDYTYAMRYPLSTLYLTEFDATALGLSERVARFESAGYTIRTLTDLQANDPDWAQKLHPLINTLADDIPSPKPHVWSLFDEWLERFQKRKELIHDGYFIAFDENDKMVGLSFFLKQFARPRVLEQGITGTLPSYRRKGIAMALKLHGSHWAQANGYHEVETANEENNPMYGLNMQLGYRPKPAELEYICKVV